jgi:hypothetical protein
MDMKIGQMFERDINRNINGVVKVNQIDDEVVYQELDEYVITPEILGHLRKFFNAYTAALDKQTDKIGIWISGFFGSGKSHFIKILSYLLENVEVRSNGSTRQALSFFEAKIDDALLVGDIRRSVKQSTDVVLFNIDSKADVHDARHRDTVLEVFMKVFNELQGYCADIPELAELERYLSSKGLYEAFQTAYLEKSGAEWKGDRDAFRLAPDDALSAFAAVTGQSLESAQKWYEDSERKYSLSVEKFAKQVSDYLDGRGKGHRIIFLVDEVGQYIGENTQQMLNLQTIAEDLGVRCAGRAWVVVTSQEDIDTILGNMPGARANDFSKIQGRFNTRISLSSTNTDEVIKCRLLEKKPEPEKELAKVYKDSRDILKNQISFTSDCATLKTFESSDDFAKSYPFLPYQFDLLQKVFESIRKVGASGAHLAKGERSMLDSFQQALRNVQEENTGVLVPFYDFYPAIEGFLEGVVIRTIERAADNKSLQPFDQQVLKVLFLIRYVNLVKPSVPNIATLCVTRIDEDKLALRKAIEESLVRLEKQTLIQRNGDLYTFLTNEERDVMNEIKSVELDHLVQVQLVSDIIFQDIFRDSRKHRLASNGKDYEYNRVCDGVFRGNAGADITVEIVSPLHEDYAHWDNTRCIMETADGTGKVVFKLKDDAALGREIATYKRTEKYVLQKDPATVPESVRRILQDHSADNRQRRLRIAAKLEELFATSAVYVLGKNLPVDSDKAEAVQREALEYLITNTYRKLPFLVHTCDTPGDAEKEIRALMSNSGNGQLILDIDDDQRHPNYQAFNEITEYLHIRFQTYDKVTVKDLADRYFKKPWGWPNWDTVLMVAQLFRSGELRLLHKGDLLDFRKAIEPLTKTRYWQDIVVQKQPTVSEEDRKKAMELVKDCFHEIPPADGEDLAAFITARVAARQEAMQTWQNEATYAGYPTRAFLDRFCSVFATLSAHHSAADTLKAFTSACSDLREFADEYALVEGFHKTQKPIFESGRTFVQAHQQNSGYYGENALAAWDTLAAILADDAPYSQIPKIKGLVQKLSGLDKAIVEEQRAKVLPGIEKQVALLLDLAKDVGANAEQSNHALYPIQQLKLKVNDTGSIDSILAAEAQSGSLYEKAREVLDGLRQKKDGKQTKTTVTLKASGLASKPYLETPEDAAAFVDAVRQRLEQAISVGNRVRIQ